MKDGELEGGGARGGGGAGAKGETKKNCVRQTELEKKNRYMRYNAFESESSHIG